MDSPPVRVANKPADEIDVTIPCNLKISNQLVEVSASGEQQLPVLAAEDGCSVMRGPNPPEDMGYHSISLAGAASQQRSTPFIYTPTSDTDYESVVEQSPNGSRKPGKVLGSQTFPPRSVYPNARVPITYARHSGYANTYSDDSGSEDDNHKISEIQHLKDEIQYLEASLKQKASRTVEQPQPEPSRYQILYRLGNEVRPNVRGTYNDEYSSPSDSDEPYRRGNNRITYARSPMREAGSLSTFTDPPVLTHDRGGSELLKCSRQVGSLRHFLKSNHDISFVVFHDYNRFPERNTKKPEPGREGMNSEEYNQPTPIIESIYPVSKELKRALEMIFDREEYSSLTGQYRTTNELAAPYLFIFHSRQEIPKIRERLSKPAQDQLDLFLAYVMKEFGDEYDAVDALLQRKEILPQYLQYLFKKGDILVENRNGEYTGYRAESWPVETLRATPNPSFATKYGMPGNRYESSSESGAAHEWTLNGFTWGFDGIFYGRWKQLKLEMPQNSCLEEVSGDKVGTAHLKGQPITQMAVFPIRYAPEHIQTILHRRGDIYWKCRVRQLVSYQADEQDTIVDGVREQYMIDMKTYKSLHPKKGMTPVDSVYSPYSPSPRKLLSKNKMARNDPPGDDFKILMPPRIQGYNFCQNKWCDLKVDQISDAVWREGPFAAFHTLEIDYEAKDLFSALVTNHLGINTSTDSMVGRSKNLTILLHGGPGTGKTHTANAIAEIAQKPLYRVACGDLGTKAEVVEERLDSAFHLARSWSCVVLFDEADIFLEQTNLGDLKRTALTSVFLRMVKDYDGIVILTSNRVAMFNEAVRSQVQLALHYPPLTSIQRYFIWKQFILRLEVAKVDADISNLLEHVGTLEYENLNGRQIQNVLTNACRYAKWKKVPLNYYHIKHMIEVSERFGTFFGNCDGGNAKDELAFDKWLH